ncbi:hypothetical protein BGW42_000793 [Actinomortierella wolfii]|nr:hypothetical protein BGW42_000793 [Actinomortierella wolfii]
MHFSATLSSMMLILIAILQHCTVVLGARFRIAHAATAQMVVPTNNALAVRPASGNDGNTEAWDTPTPAGEKIVKFQNVGNGQFAFGRLAQKDIITAAKFASTWVITNVGGNKSTIKHQKESLFWTLRGNSVVLAEESKGEDQLWRLYSV